jgi:hypothetical protein
MKIHKNSSTYFNTVFQTFVSIAIFFTVAQQAYSAVPGYSVNGRIREIVYGTDSDSDGYFETFNFDIGIDPNLDTGSDSVYGRVFCTTTSQEWWSPSPLTAAGTVTDYTYYGFSEDNFAGEFSGNTDLYFTVEIWDLAKSTLLASDPAVENGPIKADTTDSPPPTPDTYTASGSIENLVYGTDADSDGYFETFSFNIGVDADAIPGPATVYGRTVCTTTGQSWWSPDTWTVTGTAIDPQTWGFSETNFASQFSGNTELDFTVEIWDQTKSILLASDPAVENEPIKADTTDSPPPTPDTYTASGSIENLVYGTDADSDGYFETFSFNIGVDADATPGPATVYGRTVCTTTGQSWWSPDTWTVTGIEIDPQTWGFSETNFAGQFSGNTDLYFTVEIWDQTKSMLLASATLVTGEPVLADDYVPLPADDFEYVFASSGFQKAFFNIQNIGDTDVEIEVTLSDSDGNIVYSGTQNVPEDNTVCSWDFLGDIYNYSYPVVARIDSDEPLAVDCGNWQSSVGSASTVWNTEVAAGDEFVLPLRGWSNSELLVTNTAPYTVTINTSVYDRDGVFVTDLADSIAGNGCAVISGIYNHAVPAVVNITASGADVVVQSRRWSSSGSWGAMHLPEDSAAGTSFKYPARGWGNCWFNIANTGSSPVNVTVTYYDKNGTPKKTAATAVPTGGFATTWEMTGNVYSYANPALVSIESDQAIVVDSGRWSRSSGWGFTVPPLNVNSGREFAFPVKGWANSFSNIANVSSSSAEVTVQVYDASHNLKKEVSASIPPNGVKTTWELFGDIYNWASPASVKITSDKYVVVDNGRWSSSSGWGLTILPTHDPSDPFFLDSDDDGLSDEDEQDTWNTDINDPDTDDDGASDSEEVLLGTLPDDSESRPFIYSTAVKGWGKSFCTFTNKADTGATGIVKIYDAKGVEKTSVPFNLAPSARQNTWTLLGNIYSYASPAFLTVLSTRELYVDNGRWSKGAGWGLDVPELEAAAGEEHVIPVYGWGSSWVNTSNPNFHTIICTQTIRDMTGAVQRTDVFDVPPHGVVSSWDVIPGDIYNVAAPAVVEVVSSDGCLAELGSWSSGAGWASSSLPVSVGSGASFLFPVAGWSNSWFNIANTESSADTIIVRIMDGSGAEVLSTNINLPGNGFARTWDSIGDIYNSASPAAVSIESSNAIVVTNGRWSSSSGWGFNVPPIDVAAGTHFRYSVRGWSNSFSTIANASGSTANVDIAFIDSAGLFTGVVFPQTVPPGGVVTTWSILGDLYSIIGPATIDITSDQNIIVDNGRWSTSGGYSGWGFTILPD